MSGIAKKLLQAAGAGGIEFIGATTFNFAGTTSDIIIDTSSLRTVSGDCLIYVGAAGSARTIVEQNNSTGADIANYLLFLTSARSESPANSVVQISSRITSQSGDVRLKITGGSGSVDQGLAFAILHFRGVGVDGSGRVLDLSATPAAVFATAVDATADLAAITTDKRTYGIFAHSLRHTQGAQTYSASGYETYLSDVGQDTYDYTLGVGVYEYPEGGATFDPPKPTFSGSDPSSDLLSAAGGLTLLPA